MSPEQNNLRNSRVGLNLNEARKLDQSINFGEHEMKDER